MDRNKPSTTTAFNKLPIELNKEIAHYLETDGDIAKFAAICKATNHAIDGDNSSFWRTRWRERFVLLAGAKNKDLKRKYKSRAKYLRRGAGLHFGRGHSGIEQKILKVLVELINESWHGPVQFGKKGEIQCLNLIALAMFVENSFLLLNTKRLPPAKGSEPKHVHPTLAAVRLMCAHFLTGMKGKYNAISHDESQKAVYAPTNFAPIYLGDKLNEVNMEWCLHCFNFFQYYMTNPDASQLYEAMYDMGDEDKPSVWREPLQTGSKPLTGAWKGTYAYLNPPDIKRIREYATGKQPARAGDEIFIDSNVEDGNIQSIHFDFHTDMSAAKWPDAAEERLHSHRETLFDQTRAQHTKRSKTDPNGEASRNIHITGFGEDGDDFFFMTGWLNPLPDQYGIPGWQRITLMKHFQEELDLTDSENHWAYEGVVLPGGRIIVGRWWYASDEVDFDNDYSGPFILWAVESDPLLEDSDEDASDDILG